MAAREEELGRDRRRQENQWGSCSRTCWSPGYVGRRERRRRHGCPLVLPVPWALGKWRGGWGMIIIAGWGPAGPSSQRATSTHLPTVHGIPWKYRRRRPKGLLEGGSCKAPGLSPAGRFRAIAIFPVPVCSPLEMGNLTAGLSAAWNETRG